MADLGDTALDPGAQGGVRRPHFGLVSEWLDAPGGLPAWGNHSWWGERHCIRDERDMARFCVLLATPLPFPVSGPDDLSWSMRFSTPVADEWLAEAASAGLPAPALNAPQLFPEVLDGVEAALRSEGDSARAQREPLETLVRGLWLLFADAAPVEVAEGCGVPWPIDPGDAADSIPFEPFRLAGDPACPEVLGGAWSVRTVEEHARLLVAAAAIAESQGILTLRWCNGRQLPDGDTRLLIDLLVDDHRAFVPMLDVFATQGGPRQGTGPQPRFLDACRRVRSCASVDPRRLRRCGRRRGAGCSVAPHDGRRRQHLRQSAASHHA
ncbi:MAG: hypothetical protein WCK58_09220 [Chloroflexota bacterium]